jgi:hypothetical protein
MSQIYKAVSSTNLPSNVPTTFQTDSGNATPAANIIIFHGVGGTFSGTGNTVTFTVNAEGISWVDESGAFVSAANGAYFISGAATTTLPVGSQSSTINYSVDTTSQLVISAGTGQKIRIGSSISSTGGSATSNAQGSSLRLVFRAADSTWISISNNGTWTLV